MNRTLRVLIAVALCVVPAAASAVDLFGTSQTFLRVEESARGDTLAPLHEYVDLHVENTEGADLSFHLGAWIRGDLGEDSGEDSHSKDLTNAYLRFRNAPRGLDVEAGRLFVFEGVASERLDGVSARFRGRFGLSFAAYAGSPTDADHNGRSSDFVYGARLSHENKYLTVGLSYLKEDDDGDDFREEQGIDLWIGPTSWFSIQGHSYYNALTEGWYDHSYLARLGPYKGVTLTGSYTVIEYEDFFSSATLSAFMSPGLDPDERQTSFGLLADYASEGGFGVQLEYKNHDYRFRGSADSYGVSLRYTRPEQWGGGVSVTVVDGDDELLRYNRYRGYAWKEFSRQRLSVDVIHIQYDKTVSGVDRAFEASASYTYRLSARLHLGVDMRYGDNPDFEEDVRVVFRLIYHFGTAPRGT